MTTTPGSSSERTLSLPKISTVFAAELKLNLFAFGLIILGMEAFLVLWDSQGQMQDFSRDSFALGAAFFLLFFCVLEGLFGIFVKSRISAIFSVLPAALLFFLLKDIEKLPYLEMAVVVALFVRLLLVFIPELVQEKVLFWGTFVLDLVVLLLHFLLHLFSGKWLTDKLLFVTLVILSLSCVQRLIYERNRVSFPFYYFLGLGIIVALLPMKSEPIDWTPVADAGYRLVSGIMDLTDNATYYFSFGGKNYTTGYSSFEVTGAAVSGEEKLQLKLTTEDKPYFIFDDEEGGKMKVRRVLYLAGGRGEDDANIINFLEFLHRNHVDKETAMLFSRISEVNLEYVYLNTQDEIAPINSLELTSGGKAVDSGVSASKHRKGYKLKTRFLEIDYGSLYLRDLILGDGGVGNSSNKSDAGVSFENGDFTYNVACRYAKELYGISLEKFMTETSYNMARMSGNEDYSQYLDIRGATGRQTALAAEITEGIGNNYEKCGAIEKYLRQYSYNTSAVGGYNQDSSLGTPEGMADIADRFLFDTQSGYCVHFTSAMVTLLRINGIPARISVGYRYAFPFEAQDTYEIGSYCAHAWPEAYIDGIGWIPFEPTSGYLAAEDYSWRKRDKSLAAAAQTGAMNQQVPQIVERVEEGPEGPEEPEIQEEKGIAPQIVNIAAIVGLSVAVIVLLLIAGTALISRLRYRFASPEKKLKTDVDIIKKNIRKRAGEGFVDRGLLSDYTKRAPKQYQEDLEKVFGSYYRMIYGGSTDGGKSGGSVITAQETERARDLRERIVKEKIKVS